MSYAYKMVQIPQTITVNTRDINNAAANYVEGVVTQMAQGGWEFYRIDQIGVLEKPGCIPALFGTKAVYMNYSVISFRKQA